jgi:hypothetical protein
MNSINDTSPTFILGPIALHTLIIENKSLDIMHIKKKGKVK